jgi:hypothetical protein
MQQQKSNSTTSEYLYYNSLRCMPAPLECETECAAATRPIWLVREHCMSSSVPLQAPCPATMSCCAADALDRADSGEGEGGQSGLLCMAASLSLSFPFSFSLQHVALTHLTL